MGEFHWNLNFLYEMFSKIETKFEIRYEILIKGLILERTNQLEPVFLFSLENL